MLRIAIVGNIASGKSTVETFLLEKGYPVLDTDKVAHTLLEEAKSEIILAFAGYDILDKNEISREKLGKLVFKHPNLKKMLESILHPKIRLKITEFCQSNQQSDFVFVSIPLLFEAHMEDLFDKILFVYADDEIRLQRLIIRNGYDEEYAKCRIASQMSQEVKVPKADWIIYNNTDIGTLKEQILNLPILQNH